MFPPNTDPLMFSKVSELTGEYLSKIAGATDVDRKKFLCELAARVFDVWTEWRATLFQSMEDLPAFKSGMDTCFSLVLMPLLDPVQLSEAEVEAIRLTLAGRKQHWLGIVVARSAATEITSAGPSGTGSEQATAIPIADPSAAQVDTDRIKKERRQLVDAYIAECLQGGKKITRKDIWTQAGYQNRSEFERWERNDRRATDTADRNITRVLNEEPHLKKPPRP
jgi:hypothetical protein